MHELHLGSGREIRLSIEGLREKQSEAVPIVTGRGRFVGIEKGRTRLNGSGGSGAEGGKIQYRPRRVEEVIPRTALASPIGWSRGGC